LKGIDSKLFLENKATMGFQIGKVLVWITLRWKEAGISAVEEMRDNLPEKTPQF
jgi:hypothetical protein